MGFMTWDNEPEGLCFLDYNWLGSFKPEEM